MPLREPNALRRATPPNVLWRLVAALALHIDGEAFRCPTPTHGDVTPSAGVFPATHGQPPHGRWKCQGCGAGGDAVDLVRVVRELDFPEALRWLADWLDTQPDPPPPFSRPARLNVPHIDRAVRQFGRAVDLAEAWLCDHKGLDVDPWWVVAEFGLGAAGNAILLPYRRAGGDGEKAGAARRWLEDGQWKKGDLTGSRHRSECVLYGEHRDAGQPAVVLCEGESDVLAVAWWLRPWPCVSVLGVPGAQVKPTARALTLLAGRRVVLLPDGDAAGAAMAERWGRALVDQPATGAGVARLPPGLDACGAGERAVRDALERPAWYGRDE